MNAGDFQVSVVIPVYNAEKYLARAVHNVLAQPEVTELILVEDGSPDRSLDLCRKLAAENPIIKVHRHEDGVNLGAAETRNVGARLAKNEFIAFADADNFYLPNRFKLDKEIFCRDSSVDGIYHAQGIHYENDEAKQKFFDAGLGYAEFLTVSEAVPPEFLLHTMLGRHPTARMIGGLGIDAITLRRRCFEKAGYLAPELKLHQDVYFFMKLAASCKMVPGNLKEPVALRGVHGDMRSTDSKSMDYYRKMRWKLLADWFDKADVDPKHRRIFMESYSDFKIRASGKFIASLELLKSIFMNPSSFLSSYGRFDINFLTLYGDFRIAVRALSGKNRIVRILKGQK